VTIVMMLFLLLLLLSASHDGATVVSAFVTTTPLSSVMVSSSSTCVVSGRGCTRRSSSSRRIAALHDHHPTTTTGMTTTIDGPSTPSPQIGSSSPSSSSLSPSNIESLSTNGYVIIPNFIPQSLVTELRYDMLTLRSSNNNLFKIAKIGQDATNTLNTDIRIAETCFLGRNRKELTSIQSTPPPPPPTPPTTTTTNDNNKEYSSSVRDRPGGLYDILDNLRTTLDTTMSSSSTKLDPKLMELCYVYYPQGGYYRRHCDAVPNSASTLRKYSLLLYLNPPTWDPITNAGQLRLHFDGQEDDNDDNFPPGGNVGKEPNYIDIDPIGGTLVLFKSELIPHEVLNTYAERYAIVGWYNRHVSITDIGNLGGGSGISVSGEGNVVRLAALLVALTLVTYGVLSILL
jgi:hypothetical protein